MVERLIAASLTPDRLKTILRYATEAETCAIAIEKTTNSVIDKNGAIMRVVHDDKIVCISLSTLRGWLGFAWAVFSLTLQ